MSVINYSSTRKACYVGYITQAIVVNLAPIFYLLFQNTFHVSRAQIGQIIFVMFIVQLFVDIASVSIVRRIGYRVSCVIAHACAALGLALLSVLPFVMPPFAGIMTAIIIAAIGSGLIEVLISPLMESLPNESSRASMALLHSFYCWGQASVVLLSTLALLALGGERWNYIPVVWALIPFFNMIAFLKVPMADVDGDDPPRIRDLLTTPMFLLAFAVMVCAGASELAMSQWASYFAEAGLGVTKVVGDLLGPCLFAVLMAIGRTLYGVLGVRLSLSKCLVGCGVITIVSYLLAVFAPHPILSLMGCAFCGFGVSLLWPGTLSMSAERFPHGGTALFAFLAIGGDLGCSVGPFITGIVSDAVGKVPALTAFGEGFGMSTEQFSVKFGLLVVILFPIFSVIGTLALRRKKNK